MGSQDTGFPFQCGYLLAVQPWAGYFSFLGHLQKCTNWRSADQIRQTTAVLGLTERNSFRHKTLSMNVTAKQNNLHDQLDSVISTRDGKGPVQGHTVRGRIGLEPRFPDSQFYALNTTQTSEVLKEVHFISLYHTSLRHVAEFGLHPAYSSKLHWIKQLNPSTLCMQNSAHTSGLRSETGRL